MANCEHLKTAKHISPAVHVCEKCVEMGDGWVHLRTCQTCGNVGCCDSSKNKHATKHFHATKHPVIQSAQPGEHWRWCFVDEIMDGQ